METTNAPSPTVKAHHTHFVTLDVIRPGFPGNQRVDVQTMLMSSERLAAPQCSAECNNVTGVFLGSRQRNSPRQQFTESASSIRSYASVGHLAVPTGPVRRPCRRIFWAPGEQQFNEILSLPQVSPQINFHRDSRQTATIWTLRVRPSLILYWSQRSRNGSAATVSSGAEVKEGGGTEFHILVTKL